MDSIQNFTRRTDGISGGYNNINLKTSLPRKWQCPICNHLMRDAIQTYRGEMACETCFLETKGSGDVCPIDNEPIEDGEFFKDKHARREITQLPTYCTNKHNGCDWEGIVLNVEAHIPGCIFEKMTCDRCFEPLLRKDFVNHQLNLCRFRTSTCRYCSTAFEAQSMEEHEASCHMKPMQCPYECGEDIALNGLYSHVEKCVKLTTGNVCPYQLVGCTYKPKTVAGLDNHLRTDITPHAALAVSTVKYLVEANRKLKEELADEKRSSVEVGNQMDQQVREKNAMAAELSEMKRKFNEIQSESANLQEKCNDGVKRVEQDLREINLRTQADGLREMDEKLTDISNRYRDMEVTMRSGGGASASSAAATDLTAADVKKGMDKMDQLESTSAVLSANLSDLELKLQLLENTCYDGRQLWKVDNVAYRMSQAVTGKVTALHSAPCFQRKGGYKFCARLYLNGDGMGRGSHVSLFFVVMKGEYDALLQWPFTERVNFRLINPYNPSESVRESFVPDRNSSSFKRPTNEMNIAAGCPMFIRKEMLNNYIVDDTLYIEITITPN